MALTAKIRGSQNLRFYGKTRQGRENLLGELVNMALAGLLIVVAYMWHHLWNDSETSAHSCCSPTVNWISSEGQQAKAT